MKIGIDLGGSHVTIGLVNENHEIIEMRTYYMSSNKTMKMENYIVKCMVEGINEILDSSQIKMQNIEMIGIAIPGNPKGGIITNIKNLGIEELNLEGELRKKIGEEIIANIPIKLKNDGKCAGIYEKEYGSLKGYGDCLFLCIGTGIGSAVFMNNLLLEPKKNAGFEFGHIVIKKDGAKCNCGNNGCFEAYCSKRKFKKELQELLGIDGYIDAHNLIKAIKESNNKNVKKLVDEYIDNLALGISNIINIFEPEIISIGGSMSHYEDLIFDGLKEKINAGIYLFNKNDPPIIVTAQAGNEAGIIGATLI